MPAPDVDWKHTPAALEHRFEKATRLVEALHDPKVRRQVEKAAGVRRCSDETWDAALSMATGAR